MKKCPYCGEEVQDAAVKCKHCKEWILRPTNPVTPTPQTSTNRLIGKKSGANELIRIDAFSSAKAAAKSALIIFAIIFFASALIKMVLGVTPKPSWGDWIGGKIIFTLVFSTIVFVGVWVYESFMQKSQ